MYIQLHNLVKGLPLTLAVFQLLQHHVLMRSLPSDPFGTITAWPAGKGEISEAIASPPDNRAATELPVSSFL